jgi:hypothetical protein
MAFDEGLGALGKRFIAVDRASHKDGALVGEWSNDLGLKGSWHGKRSPREVGRKSGTPG